MFVLKSYWLCGIYFLIQFEDIKTEILDSCVCGKSNQNYEGRIVGGHETAPHQYPWMATFVSKHGTVFCGGSIITSLHILTAGHCAYHDPAKTPLDKFVVLGAHKIGESGEWYPIEKIYMHNHWEALDAFDKQDMAIYRLGKRIEFSKNVAPICLPNSPQDYASTDALVAGWGLTSDGGVTSNVLLEVKVTVFSDEACSADETLSKYYNAPSMMCAYAFKRDGCQGDSGGPIFHATHLNRYEQIGVTSFGIGCAEPIPAVYTKISTSLAWIHKIIEKDNADLCTDPVFGNTE